MRIAFARHVWPVLNHADTDGNATKGLEWSWLLTERIWEIKE